MADHSPPHKAWEKLDQMVVRSTWSFGPSQPPLAADMPTRTGIHAPHDSDLEDRQRCQSMQKEEFEVLEVRNIFTVNQYLKLNI
jgi:hypothetical protein